MSEGDRERETERERERERGRERVRQSERETETEMGVNQPRGGKITICKGGMGACFQASIQT